MKIETRHLAPYLPYHLKVKWDSKFSDEIFIGLLSINTFDDVLKGYGKHAYCKPILRPLSDLTKETDINGETMTYIDHLNYEAGVSDEFLYKDGHLFFIPECQEEHNLLAAPCLGLEFLKEHHFDIFGLIDAGLAININTLNQKK